MTATMLCSSDLIQPYGLNTTYLHRWRERGWIRPHQIIHGGTVGGWWPDWTGRMVALLVHEMGPDGATRSGTGREVHERLLIRVADALEADPELVWVVFVDEDGHEPIGCRTDEELAEACDRKRVLATIVGVPAAPVPEPVVPAPVVPRGPGGWQPRPARRPKPSWCAGA